MSLKAYDGMMTLKSFKSLQESIKAHLPEFEEASRNHVAKAMAYRIVQHIDDDLSLKTCMSFDSDVDVKKEFEGIEIKEDITILSYIWQCAKIFSKSEYRNSFSNELILSIEAVGRKILVYPGINVPEHRTILLKFLTDWYAQDQTDQPEDVPTREWNRRCHDWRNFSETKGMSIQVRLLDSSHYWNNIFTSEDFRGKKLINMILSHIPDDEDRKSKIIKNKFMEILMKEYKGNHPEMESMEIYWKALDYYQTEEGRARRKEWIEANPIELVKIDEEFILRKMK
jgi:hypothetical protein